MDPRLKQNNIWTAFPKEYEDQIKEIFSKTYSKKAKDGSFVVTSMIYATELLISIGYLENKRIKQVNFQTSTEFDPNKQNAKKLSLEAIDIIGGLFDIHFGLSETEQIDKEHEIYSAIWQTSDPSSKIFTRYSSENTSLEDQANELLGLLDDNLVKSTD